LTRFSALAALALFHARSAHGVEALRGFPLPVAATAFAARCPRKLLSDLDTGRSSGAAPRSDTSATPERTTPRHRSEERRFDTAPNRSAATLRRVRQMSDPITGHLSLGIHASGRSVLGEAVLPDVRRPCLSQPLWSPSRTSPFKPRLCKLQGLLSWACFQRWTNPTLKTLFRVSKNPKVGLSLSRTAVLLGVFVLKAM
jgi:hypothetical protein